MKGFLVFVLVLLLSFAGAETVMEVTVDFSASGNAGIQSVKVVQGTPTKSRENAKFVVKTATQYNEEISAVGVFVSFYSPDLFGDINEVVETVKLPFTGKEKYVVVEFNGNEVLKQDVDLMLCNDNRVCDSTETFLSCPRDCPLNEKDGFCLRQADGICDPDCLKNVDKDCVKEFSNKNSIEKEDEKKEGAFPLVFWVLLVAGILIIAFLLFALKNKSVP
jgi:hypothetical protein